MLERSRVRTPVREGDAGAILEAIVGLIRRTVPPSERHHCAGIGISTAGPVDASNGTVVNPPNIPLARIPLSAPLQEVFGVPAWLLNDCHAGALGESWCGAGRGVSHFIYLTISTGIGAGVIERGSLLSGRAGNFAEVGHFTVETTWTLPCGCGGAGHWESCGSGRFIPAFFSRWCSEEGIPRQDIPEGDTGAIFTAARMGNPAAARFMPVLGRIEACGISSLIAAYDPSLVILDGSVVRENWDIFTAHAFPHVRSVAGYIPELVQSPLNGDAPLIGAGLAVFRSSSSTK